MPFSTNHEDHIKNILKCSRAPVAAQSDKFPEEIRELF